MNDWLIKHLRALSGGYPVELGRFTEQPPEANLLGISREPPPEKRKPKTKRKCGKRSRQI